MSYQNGSATDPTDLLQQLVTWLVGIGWTQDRSATEGAGWTATLHNNGNYVHLRSAINESTIWQASIGQPGYGVHVYTGTGYTSSSGFNDQLVGTPIAFSRAYPVGAAMRLSAGPFPNYHFFADASADNIVVVVEKTTGFFVHIGWGLSIQKAGSFTGGAYFFGSNSSYYAGFASAGPFTPAFTMTANCPGLNFDSVGACCSFLRADVDAFTGKWIGVMWSGLSGNGDQGYTGKLGDCSVFFQTGSTASNRFPVYAFNSAANQFQNQQVSAQDGRANLLPVPWWVLRDGTSTGYSLVGVLPNVFQADGVGGGFSAGDEMAIGPTTYKMFPNFAVVKQ